MGAFIFVEPATFIFYTACFMHYDEVKNSCTINNSTSTDRPLYPRFQLSAVDCGPKKIWKIKETVRKFQNMRQARMGRNMVKSSSPSAPITWLIFLCPHTYASSQTCHHSASSVLTVRISCHIITVFVFRKQQEEWRSWWICTIG